MIANPTACPHLKAATPLQTANPLPPNCIMHWQWLLTGAIYILLSVQPMKTGRAIFIVAASLFIASALNVPAADIPGSRDQLVKMLTKALQAKDKNAIVALYDWHGVSESMKQGQEMMITEMFEQDVKEVKAVALSEDYPVEATLGGVHYHANVKVVGLLDITFTDENNPLEVKIPYGTKGANHYLATMIADQGGTAATNSIAAPR